MIATNNNPPNKNGFSGVISSVAGLEYELIFYGAGNSVDNINHEGTITALNLINVLEHVEPYKRQIDVVNMSFATICGRSWLLDCDLQSHMARLIKRMPDTTFVAGAGNSNLDIHEHNIIPADLTVKRSNGFSRDRVSNIITVGGITGTIHGDFGSPGSIEKADDSNFGSPVTIGAPYEGVKAVRINGPGYGFFEGTSYSTALVSGTVALMKSIKPDLDPARIKEILEDTGLDSTSTPRQGYLVCDYQPKNSSCPTNQRWPVLNAGAAIWKVIEAMGPLSDADAEILLQSFRTAHRRQGGNVVLDVFISVENTGSIDWTFYVSGDMQAHGNRGRVVDLPSQHREIRVGQSTEYQFTIEDDISGDWEATFSLYRGPRALASTIQGISIAEGVRRGVRIPSPTPTPTSFPWDNALIAPSPTPTLTPTPSPTLTRTPTPTPTLTATPVPLSTQTPTSAVTPRPTSTPVPTATPTQVPTATPVPVPRWTPIPTQTPTPPPPRVPAPSPGLTDLEHQLLRDVYACGQQSTVFKFTVISVDFFANLAGYRTLITESVMDDWDLFLPAFTELMRADPEAAETLSELLDLFCRQN